MYPWCTALSIEKAVDSGLIPINITEKCILPKQVLFEMRPLKGDDIVRFLDAVKGHPYEDAYFIAMFTGMREAELMGLTWDCIDFQRGTI